MDVVYMWGGLHGRSIDVGGLQGRSIDVGWSSWT